MTTDMARGSTASRRSGLSHPGSGSSVDEMSESSFPASDSPAVWTWETHTTPEPPPEQEPAELRI
jgi:hypothetical protein